MPEDCPFLNYTEQNGQGHVCKFWNELSQKERDLLEENVNEVQFEKLSQLVQLPEKSSPSLEDRLLPPDPNICGSLSQLRTTDPRKLENLQKSALQAVHEGKVAVLLLAGGQGTRLGSSLPKGMYTPNLPSGRSLYQIQAEKLLRVVQLAKEEFGSSPSIPWYIMTSEHTRKTTERFFEEHGYFGHDRKSIVFFEQYNLPAFGFDGKILLEKKHKMCNAPDGNGGLYKALRGRGILNDMESRGVQHIQIYCVDNILIKIPDLYFIGFCIDQSADCAAQVVQKIDPTEPIGVVGMVDNRYRVIEYSEISSKTAALRCSPQIGEGDRVNNQSPSKEDDQFSSGRLVYSHGNICVHYVTREFLERVSCPERLSALKYHVAKKKVAHIELTTGQRVEPTEPNGIKFELFVFDVFPFADRFAIWEVPRNESFSPLKNGPSASTDNPATSRRAYLALHAKYARAAGAMLTSACDSSDTVGCSNGKEPESVVEISPLITHSGENLQCLMGKHLQGTTLIEQDKATNRPKVISLNADPRSY